MGVIKIIGPKKSTQHTPRNSPPAYAGRGRHAGANAKSQITNHKSKMEWWD